MKDSPNLDVLRAVAVTLVVGSHVLLLSGEVLGYDLRALGHLGVAMFFVHTTRVLMASLQREPATAPFLFRRFFRIYPLSAAVVLFMGLMEFAIRGTLDVPRFTSNLLLIQNVTGEQPTIGPLWSLPYEVQMYLLLPALFVITRTRRPALGVTLVCAASLALGLSGNVAHFHVPGQSASLMQFVPCFLPGVLAFVLVGRVPLALTSLGFAAVLAAGVVIVPALVAAGVQETPLMWTFCVILGLAIPASRELTIRPIAQVAKVVATYSYGVYLTHAFAVGALDGLVGGPRALQWAAFFVLLSSLAYVAHRAIEMPGIALGVRVADRLINRRICRQRALAQSASQHSAPLRHQR